MAEDWVVLELSSFQLAHLSAEAPMPSIAVVTNCAPNHLDWHGSFEAYALAKQRILSRESRSPPDLTVLNTADPQVAGWTNRAVGPIRAPWPLDRVEPLAVPGQHNLANAACAAAVAEAVGVDDATIRRALRSFTGLEHRLQHVAEIAGRRFYNDSKSTTPQATLAALTAIPGPVWLLAGGHSKGARFDALASAIVRAMRGAGLFGAVREELHACIASQDASFDVHSTDQLADALAWCWRCSRPGDAILLSPACASYDQFTDFEAPAKRSVNSCARSRRDDLDCAECSKQRAMRFVYAREVFRRARMCCCILHVYKSWVRFSARCSRLIEPRGNRPRGRRLRDFLGGSASGAGSRPSGFLFSPVAQNVLDRDVTRHAPGDHVAKPREPVNPFYVLLAIVGFAFVITACAYATMLYRATTAAAAGDLGAAGLMAFVDAYGMRVLAIELCLLGAFTFGAMWLDQYRSRQGRIENQSEDSGSRQNPQS